MCDSIRGRIKHLRKSLNITMKDFCLGIGVSPNTLVAMEQRGGAPGGEILEKICSLYPELALWILTGKSGISQLSATEYVEKINLDKALKILEQQGYTVTKN